MKIIVALPHSGQTEPSPAVDEGGQLAGLDPDELDLEELDSASQHLRTSHAIQEGRALKQADPANEVILVTVDGAMGMAVNDAARACGFDRGIRLVSDSQPGSLELAEALIEVIQQEWPDLILIDKTVATPQTNPVGRVLAELLDFRCEALDTPQNTLYRLLVIREIGSGLQTVELPLISFESRCVDSPSAVELPLMAAVAEVPSGEACLIAE